MKEARSDFGDCGILVGNLISLSVKEKGYTAQYDLLSKKITILNSSNLSHSILKDMLYENSANYVGWFPVVSEKRSKEGKFRNPSFRD